MVANSTGDSSAPIDFGFGLIEANNSFLFYFTGLFFIAYSLSLLVSYLHNRVYSVVFPMTAPEPAACFTEYIILVKTSLKLGSSLDPRARVSLQLKGNFEDSPKLLLRKGKTIYFFLCRGSVNIFVYHSPIDLGDIMEVGIELFNDTPYEIPFVQWKPCYIRVLQPVSRKFWGCPIRKWLKSENSLSESFPCQEKRWDRNGIIKGFCKFHSWLSMFHCPVRLGMYSTLAHVIMLFFIKSCLLLSASMAYKMSSADMERFYYGLGFVVCVWMSELALEAFLRNTKSRFRIAKDSLFFGLLEPMESFYDLDNFALDYNWDKVIRPPIVRRSVVLMTGSKHGSAYSVFSVPTQYSMSNMWGLFTEDEEKETRLIVQIWNMCSLPLPTTMKWMAIEASGRKEEVFIRQAVNNYRYPFCVFDTWMLDWPMAYAEEPYVAGLIISHIMCNDFFMLLQLRNQHKCAYMAQLCAHQWHGLICCLFLFIILHNAEDNKLPFARIKSFISQTLTRFGKRSPREIKASWMKRSEFKTQYHNRQSIMSTGQFNPSSGSRGADNANASSQLSDVGLGAGRSSESFRKLADSEESLVGSQHMLQDMLIFDDHSTCDSSHQKRVEDFSSRFESGDSNTVLEGKTDNIASVTGAQEKEDVRQKTKLSNLFKNTDCNTNENSDYLNEMEEEDDDDDDEDDDDDDKNQFNNTEMAGFEKMFLGPPYITKYEPKLIQGNTYQRYHDEISAYCCTKKRCNMFRAIHHKVGDSALEILYNVINDLVDFVKIPSENLTISKIWSRKQMVMKMIGDMTKKANMYDDDFFEKEVMSIHEGFNCNMRLTGIYNNLKTLLDDVHATEKASLSLKSSVKDQKRKKRCVFCAKLLQSQYSHVDIGCYDLERLVKFFTKGTVYVAEKELNYQVVSRYTVQNYCAAMMSQAKEEVQLEIEDPPLVMAASVLQAMLYTLLTNLLPKQTDFNDLTADELRKLGTRLQRIKARYMTNDEEKNRSRDQKRKFEKIKHLITELGSRWRLTPNSKRLITSSKLMAECLVEERLLGLSVYAGFISKEHEALLNGDKEKLIEVESKATNAVLKIAKKVCEPIVRDILDSHNNFDVIFPQKIKELNFLVEKMSLAQYKAEPLFLATCCYYIADIVNVKVAEFKAVMKYMNEYRPNQLGTDSIPKNDRAFKFTGELKLLGEYGHSDVCSPLLRWGEVGIKGEAPLADKYMPAKYKRNGAGEFVFDDKTPLTENKNVIAALIGAKNGMENYGKCEDYDKERHLQYHLARIQASLLEQIADATQCITQITALDSDYVSEFHQDQLFNVELYASHKLNLYINNVFGVILLFLMAVATVLLIGFVCIKEAVLYPNEVKDWAMLCGVVFLIYGFILQPLKCILYSILRVYVE